MSRRLRLGALVAVGAMTAAACGSGTPQRGDTWAGSVERWLRNFQEASATGVPNLSPFLTADVIVDRRGTVQGRAEGRDAALALYRVMQAIDRDSTLRRPAYLSTAGLVVLSRWRLKAPGSRQDAALTMTFSEDGLRHEESALSTRSGQWRSAAWPTGALPDDWAPLDVLAERYVATWSRRDHRAVAALYGPSVVVRDGLLGRQINGLRAVEAAADRNVRMRLVQLPQRGGPAVFGVSSGLSRKFAKAVLLVEADDGTGCPGHVAVTVTLGPAGTVTHEERYHRVDDARRCIPTSARRHGWWDDLRVPAAVPLERTGSLRVDGGEIEVWNGTPELVGIVRWALDRYRAAGLTAPAPASVIFYPAAPRRCSGYAGLASGPRLTEITFCFGAEAACPEGGRCPPWAPPARQIVLHELAHTWMSEHVDEAARQRYADAVGLDWWEREDSWARRAVERAAETIAWGLDPGHPPLHEFGSPPDDQLTTEFRLITGHDPP